MPKRSVTHVHSILLQMIQQDFAVPTTTSGSMGETAKSHVWEVRHAGLLGVKYEVAVRTDLFETDTVEDDAMGEVGGDVLRGVVDAAVLGYVNLVLSNAIYLATCRLGDRDDDVRAVAASCLLPVASHLVEQIPDSLHRVLRVLWNCLSDMKDDLSSSVGAVMDLLGKLVTYDRVICILATESLS